MQRIFMVLTAGMIVLALAASTVLAVNRSGGHGDDILYGTGGSDRLHGGVDDDVIYGFSGNDRLFGGTGTDWIIGGYGADLVEAGTGVEVIFASDG